MAPDCPACAKPGTPLLVKVYTKGRCLSTPTEDACVHYVYACTNDECLIYDWSQARSAADVDADEDLQPVVVEA